VADKNVDSIENEIEVTRARLASTIDELVYRTSPKTIAKREVSAVKGFFVGPSGPRTDNILKVVGGVAAVTVAFVVLRKIVT
jgi:hypothetical protein